jgi:hypothetical protein
MAAKMTEQTKYLAPMPWRVGSDHGAEWTNSLTIYDAQGGAVCHLTRGYEGDANGEHCPSFTNARLIAAAPDLLDVAKRADYMCDYFADQGYINDTYRRLWNDLRAAVARATEPS